MKKWIKHHGPPTTCLSDQGRQYVSKEFNEFLKDNQIKPILATPFNPTGNSISERINQTITRVLKTNKTIPLRIVLQKINYTLQNQYNRHLKASPFEIVYKYSPFDPLHRDLSQVTSRFYEHSKKASEEENQKLNTKRSDYTYTVKQQVMKKTTKNGKLEPSWFGPYEIIQISDNGNSLILQANGKKIKANLKQIRPL